jgi:Fe-S cluster biosynthesis and repair protein YggX
VFCVRTSYICQSCSNIWIDGDEPVPPPKPKVPDYDIIGPSIAIPDWRTPTQIGLIEAGKLWKGAHVCESEIHILLMEMATRQAKYQADHNTQGHQKFQQRVEELFRTMGQYAYAEICAESWEWQENDTMLILGEEMYRCWNQSPGHWSVACKKHKYFGADMAKGSKGIWYGCIVTADKQ